MYHHPQVKRIAALNTRFPVGLNPHGTEYVDPLVHHILFLHWCQLDLQDPTGSPNTADHLMRLHKDFPPHHLHKDKGYTPSNTNIHAKALQMILQMDASADFLPHGMSQYSVALC